MSDKGSFRLDQLKDYLEYFREMGIEWVSCRSAPPTSKGTATDLEGGISPVRSKVVQKNITGLDQGNKGEQAKTLSLFEEFLGNRHNDDTLEKIREDLGDCRRCQLCSTRTHIVFGSGNPKAQLVFVGEAPGADEDMQGLPFVGKAGQLLTKIIESIGLNREEVYICNVIKCRPPNNRFPEKDEITTCSPFLLRQLEAIRPKIICCLGAAAAQTVLRTKSSIGWLRGRFQDYRGAKVLATYHPAYLLRNPEAKRDVWEDMKKIRAVLEGLERTGG
jgi:uracil-DNA glycosylase family 4